MNIGEFRNANGHLVGSIATRSIDLPELGLREVQSQHERAPVYEIIARNVGNRWVQIGALWEAVANSTGEMFLQGTIDDPSFTEPLPIALFGSNEEGFRVAWRRPQARDAFAPVSRGAPRGEGSGASQGGFGASTAGTDGALTGADEIDDDIPY